MCTFKLYLNFLQDNYKLNYKEIQKIEVSEIFLYWILEISFKNIPKTLWEIIIEIEKKSIRFKKI